MRVSRQWRNIKYLKWHGFAHTGKDPSDGELATFCPACPQPGKNISDMWMHDSNQSVMSLSSYLISINDSFGPN
jgi:hypothetical protein